MTARDLFRGICRRIRQNAGDGQPTRAVTSAPTKTHALSPARLRERSLEFLFGRNAMFADWHITGEHHAVSYPYLAAQLDQFQQGVVCHASRCAGAKCSRFTKACGDGRRQLPPTNPVGSGRNKSDDLDAVDGGGGHGWQTRGRL